MTGIENNGTNINVGKIYLMLVTSMIIAARVAPPVPETAQQVHMKHAEYKCSRYNDIITTKANPKMSCLSDVVEVKCNIPRKEE